MMVVNVVLSTWNQLPEENAVLEILPCNGSTRWAQQLAAARPFADRQTLFDRSNTVWLNLDPADWEEAFCSHPRIGEHKIPATQQAATWSKQEQAGVNFFDTNLLTKLEQANRLYEQRFGRIFLVCATGKSAAEILAILEHRLGNDPQTELREAVEQQRQITQLRLRKWLQE